MFEDVRAEERPWNLDKHARCDKSHSKREEGHHGCDESVKLPSNNSRNRALMIGLVGIVVQPHVQGRGYRHCKNSKLRCEEPNDKKCQERGRLVSSVHLIKMITRAGGQLCQQRVLNGLLAHGAFKRCFSYWR